MTETQVKCNACGELVNAIEIVSVNEANTGGDTICRRCHYECSGEQVRGYQPGPSKEEIRHSADGSISMVWCDGEPVRTPTQEDMDTLPVGEDMTDDEVANLDD